MKNEEFLQYITEQTDENVRYQAMLVYSDWLEEQGSSEHLGWRWIVKNHWRPYHSMVLGATYPWSVYVEEREREPIGRQYGDVPGEYCARIFDTSRDEREFQTRIQAEMAVAKAVFK